MKSNIEQFFEDKFLKPQRAYLEQHSAEISEHIAGCSKAFTLEDYTITYDDIDKKVKDASYLSDANLTFTDTGIKVLSLTPEFFGSIKDIIPETIEELSLPGEALEMDVSFLTRLPNLKKINIINNKQMSPEILAYIASNTNVTEMTSSSSIPFETSAIQFPGFITITSPIGACSYKNLTLTSNYYDKAPSYLNLISITIPSYQDDMHSLHSLLRKISPKFNSITSLSIKEQVQQAKTFARSLDFYFSEKRGNKLNMSMEDPKLATKLVSDMEHFAPITSVAIKLPNETPENLHYLKSIDRKYPLEILYNDSRSTNYDEFVNMRSTIDWYKQLISEKELSPIEIIAYCYDILKTWPYKEDFDDKTRSRNIPAIVTDGKIVCAGYSNFLMQLLSEFGIKSEKLSVQTPTEDGAGSHARNIVRVDDDKYSIHGLYVFDTTWDSVKENLSIVKNPATEEKKEEHVVAIDPKDREIVEHLDALTLYRYFLVPLEEYEQRFPGDTLPAIYRSYRDGTLRENVALSKGATSNTVDEKISTITNLFSPDEGYLTILKYIESPRPSLDCFKEIIKTVRERESYSKEEAASNVDHIVEIHQMLQEQGGKEEVFFTNKTK